MTAATIRRVTRVPLKGFQETHRARPRMETEEYGPMAPAADPHTTRCLMQRALLLLVVVAFIPRAAAAQGEPVGPEFRVNTYTTYYQSAPSIAADASGNFVVVWQ